MNSRERVCTTLNRGQADRIPNGICGCETAGMHTLAYEKARSILSLFEKATRVDTFMFNAVAEQDFLEAAGCDIILLASPRMCAAPLWGADTGLLWHTQNLWGREILLPRSQSIGRNNGNWVWQSTDGWSLVCPENGHYFDNINPPSAKITPDTYNPPHELPETLLRELEATARELYENTNYFINCGETIIDMQFSTGSTEDWWLMLIDEQNMVKEFLEKSLEASLAQLRQLEQAIGKYCGMLSVAHDFGDARGVTIGPDLWREVYKPFYRRWFSEWKRITGMKINLHSCGAIADILPDLIECGVDVLNPVQISAAGMNPAVLKERFGNSVIFYGGAYDAVQTPPGTAYHTVYQTVCDNIKTLSSNGGYIFAGVHNLPADTPTDHLRAIFQAYNDMQYNL